MRNSARSFLIAFGFAMSISQVAMAEGGSRIPQLSEGGSRIPQLAEGGSRIPQSA